MRFQAPLPTFSSLGHTRGINQIWERSLGTRLNLLRALVVCVAGVLAGWNSLYAQTCPAYGNDKDCGTIITITDSGMTLTGTLTSTGEGPYDGFDDTLVGVVNKSSKAISTISLSSAYDIFGFDGDGVVTYGAPGNALDTSGYGGPNAYFQNINSTLTGGDVYFINPIPAFTGVDYFSLENALTSASFTITGLNSAGGTIYVADDTRVQTFTSAGVFKNQFTITGPGYRFLFGASGIAADSAGNTYLTDTYNKTVVEFDASGNLLRTFGSFGSGNGQFQNGIAGLVVSGGNVFVVDGGNDRVEIFSATGTYVSQFGSHGHGAGQFIGPVVVASDAAGNIFVADSTRVQKFTSSGVFISQFTLMGGFLFGPSGLAVDAADHAYVTDSANKKIVEFDSTGAIVQSAGTYGNGNGQFGNGVGNLALLLNGDVIVADSANERVQDFTSAGVFQGQFGSQGGAAGQFNGKMVLAVGP